MVTRIQKIRVITLLGVTALIFLYVMFLLVGKKIMTRSDIYFIRLEQRSVAGLNIGTDVRYYGINVGKVSDISINPENISEVIVTVSIRENTPIKETSQANLSYQSIATGLKQIEITGGENEDRTLNPGEFIRAGSTIFDDITGRAEIVAQKVETLLNNMIYLTSRDNTYKIVGLIDQLDEGSRKLDTLITEANLFFRENRKELSSLLKKSSVMVTDISKASRSADNLLRDINETVGSEQMALILNDIAEISHKLNTEELSGLVSSFNNLIAKSEDAVVLFESTFIRGRGNLLRSIELFKETLENLNEFAIIIRDNPEILIRGKDSD